MTPWSLHLKGPLAAKALKNTHLTVYSGSMGVTNGISLLSIRQLIFSFHNLCSLSFNRSSVSVSDHKTTVGLISVNPEIILRCLNPESAAFSHTPLPATHTHTSKLIKIHHLNNI